MNLTALVVTATAIPRSAACWTATDSSTVQGRFTAREVEVRHPQRVQLVDAAAQAVGVQLGLTGEDGVCHTLQYPHRALQRNVM